jgi:hypothetical protein
MSAQSEPLVLHGERKCEHLGCRNGAYWCVEGIARAHYLCGTHSRNETLRTPLPKKPQNARARIEKTLALDVFIARVVATCVLHPVDAARVECVRLVGFGRQVPFDPACRWLTVFPNNKHAARTDGLGMPELSPMRLGPVHHGEPGVPAAWNIENFHQFSKMWPSEADPSRDWAPLPAWFAHRDAGFVDRVPHRHKFDAAQMKQEHRLALAGSEMETAPNAPLYALHVANDGTLLRVAYVASRAFYCSWYEHLARTTPQFQRLCDLYAHMGVSLRITGYDGHALPGTTDDDLYAAYCNPALPFGHERVLAALILCHGHPGRELPWRRYMREHAFLYTRFSLPTGAQ